MILEKFFTKKAETKKAKSWMTALETREIQKNSYRATGDLKSARQFAEIMSHEIVVPAQVPEVTITPIEIFSKHNLAYMGAVN